MSLYPQHISLHRNHAASSSSKRYAQKELCLCCFFLFTLKGCTGTAYKNFLWVFPPPPRWCVYNIYLTLSLNLNLNPVKIFKGSSRLYPVS